MVDGCGDADMADAMGCIVGDAGMVDGCGDASCEDALKGFEVEDAGDCQFVNDAWDRESSDSSHSNLLGGVDVGGYEADEGELPDSVYDEPIEFEDSLFEVDESTYNSLLFSDLLEDLNHDPEEVLAYIKGAGRNDTSARQIMYKLFDQDEEVTELREMNKNLVADMESLRARNQETIEMNNKLVAQLEVLQAAHENQGKAVGKLKCGKKPLQLKQKHIAADSGKIVLRKSMKGNRKPSSSIHVSALKMNSMVRRIKERAHWNKKRNSEFTYHSKTKKAKTCHSKKLQPIVMEFPNDA